MIAQAPAQGFSNVAGIIAQAQQESYDHLVGSATFSKRDALDELGEVWEECRRANWDGSGAVAVEQDTLRNAYQFIEALPLDYPLPSVGVEPDGHLTLEWYRSPRWTLSVSVTPEGTLYYSALFGSEDPRGSSPFFDEIPQTILFLIKRACRP
jgi:hypothetical protein